LTRSGIAKTTKQPLISTASAMSIRSVTFVVLDPVLGEGDSAVVGGLAGGELSGWIRTPKVAVQIGPSFRKLQHPLVEIRGVGLGSAQCLNHASYPRDGRRVVDEPCVVVGELSEVVCVCHVCSMKAPGSG
jgi:hypothetical protein